MAFDRRPMSTPLQFAFGCADQLRRRRGAVLDELGFGPVMAPSRIVCSLPGMRLHDYGGPVGAPAFVAVAAPIKRAYIWDLASEASVMRRISDRGFRPILIEWLECSEQASFRLADYADRLLLAAIDAVTRRTGQRRVILAGHSFGGTLAALFAALHPTRVLALLLLEAPTSFAAAGAFAPLVAATPVGIVPALFNVVPGSVLDVASVAASPLSFLWARWLDRFMIAGDPRGFAMHLRVERWALDEFPLPAALLGEIVDRLYREDRFMRGTLSIDGQTASPAALDMPLLTVMRPESLVIPPAAVRPLHDAAPSRNKRLLRYDGESGTALRHVGVLVGARAHHELWPEILRWTGQFAA